MMTLEKQREEIAIPDWLQGGVRIRPRQKKGIPIAEQLSDFRVGIDEVRRWNNRVFVVDTHRQLSVHVA